MDEEPKVVDPKSIRLIEVASHNIYAYGYDEPSQTLVVQFRRGDGPGSIYAYSKVPPEVWSNFLEAESKGKYFDKSVKPFKELYPYSKVE